MASLSLASLSRPARLASRLCQRQAAYRCLSSTVPRSAEVEDGDASVQTEAAAVVDGPAAAADSFKEFLQTIAVPYREARPTNWLSETPFPMNPSFRPSPPISDVQRDAMYNAYMADPMKNNVRTLAQRYGMSLKRVDAILRLKGLERDWAKNKRLQNGFQAGMEILLGATTHKAATSSRYDINEADILEQDENRDALRQRYQRAYWESVSEAGQEPIVPGSLEHARKRALQYAQSAEDFKTIPQLLPKVPDTEFMKRPTESVVIRQRVGRPSLQFVDVGAKFMDVNERVKQISQASRRASRRRAAAVARSQSWRDTVTEAAEAEVS